MKQSNSVVILLFLFLLMSSCTEPRFDNPFDPQVDGGDGNQNYNISQQPTPQSVVFGNSHEFFVGTEGEVKGFFWKCSEDPGRLDGNNSRYTNRLMLSDIGFVDEGEYYCEVTFANDQTISSDKAYLAVSAYEVQPMDQTRHSGESVTFECRVPAIITNPGYQWERSTDNGVSWSPVDDGIDPLNELIIDNLFPGAHHNNLFRCAVMIAGKPRYSKEARLEVFN